MDVLATDEGFEDDARVGVENKRSEPIAAGAGSGAVKSTLEVGAEAEEGPTERGTGRETEAKGLRAAAGGGEMTAEIFFGGEDGPAVFEHKPATPPALAAAANSPPLLAFLSFLFLPSKEPEACLPFLTPTERERDSSSSSDDGASAAAAVVWEGRLRVWPGL